jgi:hypothetical protein
VVDVKRVVVGSVAMIVAEVVIVVVADVSVAVKSINHLRNLK